VSVASLTALCVVFAVVAFVVIQAVSRTRSTTRSRAASTSPSTGSRSDWPTPSVIASALGLRIAREVGGGELGRLLRNLSGYLRDEARTRSELESRRRGP